MCSLSAVRCLVTLRRAGQNFVPLASMQKMRWRSSAVNAESYENRNSSKEECSSSSNSSRENTFNQEEVKKFEKMSSSWWDHNGLMKELHSMNKLRVPLVRDGLLERQELAKSSVIKSPEPLQNLSILDVGCGGGILTEPLARLGATVLGLDPGQENISVAELHVKRNSADVISRVSYKCDTIEGFIQSNPDARFDGVVSSETVEHVDNPEIFLKMMGQCVKPGGSLFLTTLNRTFESWAGAIVAWEYILRKLPVGTHQWKKFLTPQEVQRILTNYNFKINLIHGMCYNPISNQWSWSRSTSINYCIHAVKEDGN